MLRPNLLTLFATLGALAGALPATAQTPFSLRVQQGQTVTVLTDGGTAAMSAEGIGTPVTATLTVTYRGTTSATIGAVEFSGSLNFTVSNPTLPLTLSPGQSFTANIRFVPSTSDRAGARVSYAYQEGRISSSVTLSLTGTTPEFAFSYVPQGGNATPIQTGGNITFPVTAVNASSTATVALINRGTGSGVVRSITAGGSGFQLSGLPLPDTTVDAGKEIRFVITFSPTQLAEVSGTLTVETASQRAAFVLRGSGSGPQYIYEVFQENSFSGILPNQTIAVPDALVGEKSALQVRVRNGGNAEGRIAAVSIQGTGFQLVDVPFLPVILAPGSSAVAGITFTPTQPGRTTGRLRIGDDVFDIAGNGLGAQLAFSYAAASSTITLQNNGSVIFTPAAVGRTSSVRFVISNNGTAPATVHSISLTAAGSAFTISDVPALPLTVAAGELAPFTILFAPTAAGSATATLKVDTQTFTLSGSGEAPDPLPSFRFEGPGGSVQPIQQPAIGITLSAAYPLPITGTLTLTFNSDVFANDPSVQFAGGGRTVNFTVPAQQTRAIFPNGGSEVRLQTGTVAGIITLTPSFSTEGGINLTPAAPPVLNLQVAQAAPQLLNVTVLAKTTSTLTLLVTGFATTRSITQMDFQFAAVSGENLGTTRVTLPVEPNFLAWYQSAASQQFGSLFTATVPFTLQGDVKNALSAVDAIESVSVTLANRQGSSSSRTISLK